LLEEVDHNFKNFQRDFRKYAFDTKKTIEIHKEEREEQYVKTEVRINELELYMNTELYSFRSKLVEMEDKISKDI